MNTRRTDLRSFGNRIASKRKELKLTQSKLAKEIGIAPTYLASIETGRRWPRLLITMKITQALGLSLYELMQGWE